MSAATRRKEFSSFSMVATLVVICLVAGAVMAAVQRLTAEPIEAAKRQEKLEAIRHVLQRRDTPDGPFRPLDYVNEPDQDAFEVNGATAYPARDSQGRLVGLAVIVSDPKGYGGPIRMMVGLDAEGRVMRIQKLEMSETPGLGDAVAGEKFLDPLLGQSARSIKWAVRKDGGDVDAVTAATISSRAAVRAISSAFDAWDKAVTRP